MRSRIAATSVLLSLTVLGAATTPALAANGYYYEARTSTSVEGKKPEVTMVYSWIASDSARIEFVEGPKKGVFSKGSYLLTTDGGRTMKLVDPKEETWSEIDVEAMLNLATTMMANMGAMASITFEDAYNEPLLDEAGDRMLGRKTTHKRWKSGLTTKVKMMGFNSQNTMDMLHDIWITDELDAAGFRAWLRPGNFRTGNEELDAVIRGDIDKMTGFPLKTVTVTTTTNKKGKQSTSTSETLVTELREEDVADQRFTVPAHYEHRPIMFDEDQLRAAQAEQQDDQTAAADATDDEKQEGGLKGAKKKLTSFFGKKKKKKDKDD